MNNQEIEEYLESNGFEYAGGDGGKHFDNSELNITFWIAGEDAEEGDRENNISFNHSSEGWHELKNPSEEQIKSIVSIFKSAQWTGMEDIKKLKKNFTFALIERIKDLVDK